MATPHVRPLLAVLVAAAAAGVVAVASAGAHSTACSPGLHTVRGATVRTFCGAASATAKAAGRTFRFAGGQCAVSHGFFTVNIGSVTLGNTPPRLTYLGIDVQPPTAGTHVNQVVSWQVPGKRFSVLSAKVTLSAGRHGGTFSGPLLGGGAATGAFSCS